MASANDRKISQLPVASGTEDTTNFIVVSGIGTTPVNERITTQTLFNNVPVSLVVGQEFAGKNVIFNATDDPTHRFTFTHETGDIDMGSNASIAKNLNIGGNLVVDGTTTFANTNFIQLSVSGATTFNDTVLFHKQIQTNDRLTAYGDGSIGGNFHVVQNTNLNTLTVSGGTNLNSVSADTISLTSVVATGNITVSDLDVTDITVSGNTNVDVIEATGFIRTTANMFAQTGNFNRIAVTSPSVFSDKVNAEVFEATNDVLTRNLEVLLNPGGGGGNATINNNLDVVNTISANSAVIATETQTNKLISQEIETENIYFKSAKTDIILGSLDTAAPNGTVQVYQNGVGTYFIVVKTPDGWRGTNLTTFT